MQLVEIYQYLILCVVTFLTFYQSRVYKRQTINFRIVESRRNDAIGFLLFVTLTLMIGLRPLEYGMASMWGDTVNYYNGYLLAEGDSFFIDFSDDEYLWQALFRYIASKKLGCTLLFFVCDALYFGCTYLACRKWFPRDTTMAYLVFLGAFSTFSYSYNGVRAGVAGALFLLGVAYYEKKWLSIILVVFSWGFHHSMQMPIAAYILTLLYKNPKWYFYSWAICALIAIAHITFFQEIFANMSDESGAGYLNNTNVADDGTVGGFRLDFLLYSAMPVLIGYKIVIKEKIKVSKQYSALLHMYLCTNGIWMLCMYANFTNRIAYLSWFMYPFVLIYPFLKEDLRGMLFLKTRNQYSMLAKVAVYHLLFTLFMELVYYKILK